MVAGFFVAARALDTHQRPALGLAVPGTPEGGKKFDLLIFDAIGGAKVFARH
jgi:hypothetical protein